MYSVNEIKKMLENSSIEDYAGIIKGFKNDERKGVQAIIKAFERRLEREEEELNRLDTMLAFERECYEKGLDFVLGIDEVGRGPLAGPVMTAAVILPKNCKIIGINDSKKLSAKKREELYDIICDKAIEFSFGIVSPKEIDEINILQATYQAMRLAISKINGKVDFILADAVTIPGIDIAQKGIIKGDAKSISIAAASIIAKVERDKMMVEYDKLYPEYGFSSNKGYGSKEHIKAIEKHGICPIHRRSFVKNFIF